MPYLPVLSSQLVHAAKVELDLDIVHLIEHLVEWIVATSIHLKIVLLPIVQHEWRWLIGVFLSMGKFGFGDIFERPSQWLVQAFHAGHIFLIQHPHVVHVIAFSIFFGPIVVLLPFLLIHELVISLLLHLSFAMHGLIPGSIEARYNSLRTIFLNARESTFASVDSAGSVYNKWTSDYTLLAMFRVAALGIGSYALHEIWSVDG